MKVRLIRQIAGGVAFAAAAGCAALSGLSELSVGPDVSDAGDAATDAPPGEGGGPRPNDPTRCVPAPPDGVEGPFAVVRGAVDAALACPSGYGPALVVTGFDGVEAQPPKCVSGSCSCGAAAGAPACTIWVGYHSDNTCTKSVGTKQTVGADCIRTSDESAYARIARTLSGVSCPPSGDAAVDTIADAAFVSRVHACRPEPSRPLSPCGADGGVAHVAMPDPGDASACVRVGGACPAAYPRAVTVSTTGSINDTRGCACACVVDADGVCTGGVVSRWSTNNCRNAASGTIVPEACTAKSGLDRSFRATSAPAATGPAACDPTAEPTGRAAPAPDVTLCCAP